MGSSTLAARGASGRGPPFPSAYTCVMVTWHQVGEDYEFVIEAQPPLIYLDHWAVRRLSENPVYGNRFLTAFKHRGTVMFSLMNVTEIARDASPRLRNLR